MIIDNAAAISCMKKDIEYFYYDLEDLKFIPKNVTVFSNSIEELSAHKFVSVRVEDDAVISVHTDDVLLISEAVSFAKEKGKDIYFSLDKDTDVSFLNGAFSLEKSEDQGEKHWGIYGAIKNAEKIKANKDVSVSAPDQKDIEYIASLPNKEWAFLPQRIKFMKNILIAKKGNDLLGYLVYASIENGHYDIVMLYVHPNSRRLGAASALVKAFALECENKNGVPYYVCANSEGSARLASALGIAEIRKETVIYKLM